MENSDSGLFYLFEQLHLLSSDSFSSLIFFLLPFSSLTLPTSAFPSVHSVGSLTSKLPSNITSMSISTRFRACSKFKPIFGTVCGPQLSCCLTSHHMNTCLRCIYRRKPKNSYRYLHQCSLSFWGPTW